MIYRLRPGVDPRGPVEKANLVKMLRRKLEQLKQRRKALAERKRV